MREANQYDKPRCLLAECTLYSVCFTAKVETNEEINCKTTFGTRFSKLLILWEISPWIKLKAGFYMF